MNHYDFAGYGSTGYGRRKRSFNYSNEAETEDPDYRFLLRVLELLSTMYNQEEDVSNSSQKTCLLHQVCNWSTKKPVNQNKWLKYLKSLHRYAQKNMVKSK